jgi:hypothetical protein
MAGEELTGLPLILNARMDEGTLARFWGSLNQPIRPAIQFWTAVPIMPEKPGRVHAGAVRGSSSTSNVTRPCGQGASAPTQTRSADRQAAVALGRGKKKKCT